MTETPFVYVGSELDLFADVTNWKSYWSSRVRPYISGDVLEVGAGIGSNAPYLHSPCTGRVVALEPDGGLVDELRENLGRVVQGCPYDAVCGTLDTLPRGATFDTILYIDVLEHIEDDAGEMKKAAAHLKPGGRVIVLSPAHQWLFTPFDASIGHFRRYNKRSLKAATPADLKLEKMFYLDTFGILASAANQVMLRQSMPTKSQLAVWDKWIIPVSRVIDPVLAYSVGKSIVGVWRKP